MSISISNAAATNINYSDIASLIEKYNGDVGVFRPFRLSNGVSAITYRDGVNADGTPILKNQVIQNAATLRREDWLQIDTEVVRAATRRLRFFNDLRANGLSIDLPNALGKTSWTYERQSNISDADVSMDGLRRSDASRLQYDSESMPLPLIHCDLSFSAREIAISRSGNSPIDISAVAEASERVAEKVEKMALGVDNEFIAGGGAVYGVCNYPRRLSRIFTNPWNADGSRDTQWTPGILQREILEARRSLNDHRHYGPFVIYHSPDFDEILDDDYNLNFNGLSTALTLRERLLKIDQIQAIRTSEFLPFGTFVMVEMSRKTIQAVNGMDITTIQWQTEGGFENHFKVMCILLPRMKSDFNGNCGVLHARLGVSISDAA